jgi:hypothetical protein
MAYLVTNKLAEDRLRFFKTHLFKVVRCKITLDPLSNFAQPHVVDGLTFVFDQGPKAGASIRSMRTGNPDGEPSILFEGYTTALPTEFDSQGKPLHVTVRCHNFVFPILKTGRAVRNGGAARMTQRRMYEPQNRRRSPLIPNSPPRPASPIPGVPGEDTPRSPRFGGVLHPIGSPLTRMGEQSTHQRAGNWWDEPLGITTNTTCTEVNSSLQEDDNTVEHIEDVQEASINSE